MFRTLRQIFAVAIPVLLILLHLAVILCFWNRWDELVVVTLIPIWAWAAFGVIVSAIAWPLLKTKLALVTFGLWLITGISLSDETAGLLREFRSAVTTGKPAIPSPEDESRPRHFRVVSINCADGQAAATADLEKLDPDLVLLQEAPDRDNLVALAEQLFGNDASLVRSTQCAIIGRGRVSIVFEEPATGSLVATVERPDGELIDVVNLHLPPAVLRMDVWRKGSWAELTQRRKENRRTLRSLVEALPKRIGAEHQIVGGGFGTPPSDDIFRLLRNALLTDSYRRAGYGWGNTYPSSIPLLRVDQIWASTQFQPLKSEAFSPQNSDHRYVVTDFLKGPRADALALSARQRP